MESAEGLLVALFEGDGGVVACCFPVLAVKRAAFGAQLSAVDLSVIPSLFAAVFGCELGVELVAQRDNVAWISP